MIRHVVLFRFSPESERAARAEVLNRLAELPGRFDQMRNWTMGVNRSERDDRYEYGFVVDFESVDDLDRYLKSAEHESFVRELFAPNIAERAIVSFDPSIAPMLQLAT